MCAVPHKGATGGDPGTAHIHPHVNIDLSIGIRMRMGSSPLLFKPCLPAGREGLGEVAR